MTNPWIVLSRRDIGRAGESVPVAVLNQPVKSFQVMDVQIETEDV
jgi:hypothetical protein